MPKAGSLPASLLSLTFRQASKLRPDPDFRTDMDRLIRGLRGAGPGDVQAPASDRTPSHPGSALSPGHSSEPSQTAAKQALAAQQPDHSLLPTPSPNSPVPKDASPMPPQADKPRHQLHDYPRFPMVPSHKVPTCIKQAYANFIPVRQARDWIDRANSFREEADPEDTTVTLIKTSHLRSPEDNAPIDFWIDAFNEAGKHGPRMLAALLLVVDDAQFDNEVKQERSKLLKLLRDLAGPSTRP
jgi:hypothetical protein